jgi:hypothetical protein
MMARMSVADPYPLSMKNISMIIKDPPAWAKTAISTEQKSEAASSIGAKGGLPPKIPSATE